MVAKSKSNDFKAMHQHMEQIKKVRTVQVQRESAQEKTKTFEQVRSAVKGVVEGFVKGDRSLMLQSSDSNSFYVSCGLRHVCRVWIQSANDELAVIRLHGEHDSTVYSGKPDKSAIEERLKAELLQWYSSIFSV